MIRLDWDFQKRVYERTTLIEFVVFCVTLVSLIGWGMGGVGGVVVCSVHRGLSSAVGYLVGECFRAVAREEGRV